MQCECNADPSAPAAAPEEVAERKRRRWMTRAVSARKVGKLAHAFAAAAVPGDVGGDVGGGMGGGGGGGETAAIAGPVQEQEGPAMLPGSPDARGARALLAVQGGLPCEAMHAVPDGGAHVHGTGPAVHTKDGVACVRFVSRVDRQILVVVRRSEGQRLQYFTLRSPRAGSAPCRLPTDFCLYSVELPAMRWDIARQCAVVPVGQKRTVDAGEGRSVTFVIRFGQQENAVAFQATGGGDGGVVLQVMLRDARERVTGVDLFSCSPDARPAAPQAAVMANLCCKVVLPWALDAQRLRHVMRRTRMQFGCVYDVPTTAGRLGVQQDLRTMYVKGACQFQAVLDDAQSLLEASAGQQGHLLGAWAPSMRVYMLVLIGAVGAIVNMRLGGSLLERSVRWHPFLRGILSVYPRTEEEINRLEFVSHYTKDIAAAVDRLCCAHGRGGCRTVRGHVADARLHISITRKGEMIFLFGFLWRMLEYDAAVDEWVRGICNAYMSVFSLVLDGSLQWD